MKNFWLATVKFLSNSTTFLSTTSKFGADKENFEKRRLLPSTDKRKENENENEKEKRQKKFGSKHYVAERMAKRMAVGEKDENFLSTTTTNDNGIMTQTFRLRG